MIVGYPPEGSREQLYLSNIINGAFDADKIDYIARDSYFTGIALGAEVEMLMQGYFTYLLERELNSPGFLKNVRKINK